MRRLLMLAALVAVGLVSVGAGTAAASSTLPDNRGWEIVTPPDQNYNVIPKYWLPADGNAAVFTSMGAFAGGLNGGGDGYIARRGPDGWTTQAMAPPGSGTGDSPLFAPTTLSRDGSHIIWTTTGHPGQDIFFGTGRYTALNISGGVRPSSYAAYYEGQTPDSSHVVFGIFPPFGSSDTGMLYDYTGGSVKPVGILPGETTPAAGGAVLGSFDHSYGAGSVFHAVSGDGSRIFFESPMPAKSASFQLPKPSGLYVRENGATTKAIDANAMYWDATSDGSTVLYAPADGSGDLGLSTYDVDDEHATEIVPASAQVQGVGGVSDDLSRIYFVALADLADGATAGQGNLYLYDSESDTPLRFVATLAPASGGTWIEAARFSSTDGYNGTVVTSAASADGRLLAFVSKAKLTGYDNQGVREVYLFDAEATTDPIVCLSCSPDGSAPIGDSFLQTRGFEGFPGRASGQMQQIVPPMNITVDNRRVFFETRNALVPQDHNGVIDVYEWQDGAPHLLSSGAGSDSWFVGATPSGDDVFFITKNSLTWQAKSGDLRAIYDARVDGGFPAPPGPVTPCDQGTSCQGPVSAPALVAAAASVGFQGSGNVTEQGSSSAHARRAPVFRVGTIGRKARARLARGARAAIRVRVGTAGKVRVVLRAKVGKRTRTVARGSRTARHAGTVRLTVRLSKPARRVLRRGHRLRVQAVVRYSKVHAIRRASFTLAGAGKGRGR